MEGEELTKLYVTVVPEFVASEEFDRMAKLFGYVKNASVHGDAIRCKDCRYYSNNRGGYVKGVCEFWATDHVTKRNDFCSNGVAVNDLLHVKDTDVPTKSDAVYKPKCFGDFTVGCSNENCEFSDECLYATYNSERILEVE